MIYSLGGVVWQFSTAKKPCCSCSTALVSCLRVCDPTISHSLLQSSFKFLQRPLCQPRHSEKCLGVFTLEFTVRLTKKTWSNICVGLSICPRITIISLSMNSLNSRRLHTICISSSVRIWVGRRNTRKPWEVFVLAFFHDRVQSSLVCTTALLLPHHAPLSTWCSPNLSASWSPLTWS